MTPSNGIAPPPVSRVDKAPETATKLLTRIAVSVEQSERHLFWISLPIKIAFVVGGLAIAGYVFVVIMSMFDHR